ncbi:hypothetical protein [Nocardioides campestrisoli]|uniref:hypothetical protein n=1 Tax=Nocardioides campestrisoli TaxID=2736757 RepID=UPI00163D9492|nr:hypothetical protein [Nocardioides campestrisoli]
MSRTDELLEGDVDAIAEALREDPVQVPQMFGNGHTDQVRAGLREIVEEADFPVYVVMVPEVDGVTGDDAAREVATLLHTRLGGGDAVIAVHTQEGDYLGTEVATFGDAPDEGLINQAATEHAPNGGADAGVSEPGLIARDLTVLLRHGEISRSEYKSFAKEEGWRAPPDWRAGEGVQDGIGSSWVLAVLVGSFVAGAAWLLWGGVAERLAAARKEAEARGPEPVQATPGEVRAEAERELDAVARTLADRAASLGGDTRVLVDGSYDTARSLLERGGSADLDLGDLVGAQVLARVARHALSDDGGRAPWRPCFVDPRHGEGAHQRRVPVGTRQLEVPVCADCHDRAALWPMRVVSGPLGRARPWYELDTVWARTGYGAFVEELWQPVARELGAREVDR